MSFVLFVLVLNFEATHYVLAFWQIVVKKKKALSDLIVNYLGPKPQTRNPEP
jgi:hypothetical protein